MINLGGFFLRFFVNRAPEYIDDDHDDDDDNKWSKNSDERSHRRPVTPYGDEWIRPTLSHLIMLP